MKKIVVPTKGKKGLDDEIAEHFGRCETYTFLDENGKVIEIIDNTSEHMGGIGLPAELIREHGANVLLCKGLGPKALNLCNALGIEVYVYQARKVREIFEIWKKNKVKKAGLDDVCKEHKSYEFSNRE